MSAFVVAPEHINAIVSWGEAHKHQASYWWAGRRRPIAGDAARVASVLHAQNVRSVNARYEECDPGHGHRYVQRPRARQLSAVQLLGALDCYEYQASETDDWPETEAHAIVDALRRMAIMDLPGYAWPTHDTLAAA